MSISPKYKMVIQEITGLTISGPVKFDSEKESWTIGGSSIEEWLERLDGKMVSGELKVFDGQPDDTELVAKDTK